MNRLLGAVALFSLCLVSSAQDAVPPEELLGSDFPLANSVPPLEPMGSPKDLPLPDKPFIEHVRMIIPGGEIPGVTALAFDGAGKLVATAGSTDHVLGANGSWTEKPRSNEADPAAPAGVEIADSAIWGKAKWYATPDGLYISADGKAQAKRHESYGVGGPLATNVTSLALVGDTMFVGTPLGISIAAKDGSWSALTGDEGLPYENVTAIESDGNGGIWIGTTEGAIYYRPGDPNREWYYRWGQRYLPGNQVVAIACAADGTPYFATDGGIGAIQLKETTLLEKAQSIEERVNARHRRLGMVAECQLDDALNPTSYTIHDNDNDGLWSAYHIAAMSLAYGATKDPKAKASATEGMHALYMLQNASGIPGLVARSVVPIEEGKAMEAAWREKASPKQIAAGFQWRPTPDGKYYWKSDTSSDEIDGHYLAFYTYWTHIAKDDPKERQLCIDQCRTLTNYIVDHNYQLIDWDGKRTLWGFWNPENLNNDPEHYIEGGLNALQILSFLKTAHTITGDEKFKEHYKKLIVEHHYLSNVLTSKKVFPDENNHSDDQLGHVAWYPILQQEKDPAVRAALHAGIRRHYSIVAPEKPSFYTFIYATIDPDHADIAAGLENLQEIPEDRRVWAMNNSQRADVVWDPMVDRFDKHQLIHVLPADERVFEKWNKNPYVPDGGGDGRHEDDGAAYLLPYWMGRYHGFIAPAE